MVNFKVDVLCIYQLPVGMRISYQVFIVQKLKHTFSISPSMSLQVTKGTMGRVGLRDDYYKHLSEASLRLRSENPGLSKAEALIQARKEC